MTDTPDNKFATEEQRDRERSEKLEHIRQDMREKIAHFGYTHIGVFDAEEKQAPFIYTVGRHLHNVPELIVTGAFDNNDLGLLISNFGRLEDGAVNTNATLVEIKGAFDVGGVDYNVRTVEVDAGEAVVNFLVQAPMILQQQVERVQWIQLSDAAGRWPGEEGFDNLFRQLMVAKVIATPQIRSLH